jgi:hypothetical protein
MPKFYIVTCAFHTHWALTLPPNCNDKENCHPNDVIQSMIILIVIGETLS